jgi:hypothetical protein
MAKRRDRSGIFIEFIPYRFSGDQTLTRSFRFGGVTYGVDDRVSAKARLNFVSVGYQYNVLNSPRLELGIVGAAAYVAVKARANSPAIGSAEVNRAIPFPLVGLAAHYSPVVLRSWFSIRGETRGMSFGSYGRYFDGAVALGFDVSPHVTFEPGYRVVDGDGHHATRGAQFNFRGPAVAVRVHDK